MIRIATFAFTAALLGTPAIAQTSPFQAFTEAVNRGSVEGCTSIFVEGAPFLDIGKDLTTRERKQWFCDAVVKANSRYTILSENRQGDTIVFTVDYRAGSYFLQAKGSAKVTGDKIASMTIEGR